MNIRVHRSPSFGRSGGIGVVMIFVILCFCDTAKSALKPLAPRQTISLDGTWQIEQGGMDKAPASFTHTVPVPGLVDLATPAFAQVGQVSIQRKAFWYRRGFRVDQLIPEIALLKLHKSRYGTTVWLNGKLVGQHMPCFTPVEFDAHTLLRQGENELLIRIGANREAIPADQPSGWDYEVSRFIPGIYDHVELILSGAPYILNVQTVPDPVKKSVRIVAEIEAGANPGQFTLHSEVVEAKSKASAGKYVSSPVSLAAGEKKKLDFVIPLKEGHLWSPEDPFLYELRLQTGTDAASVRFGLRSFRLDSLTRRPFLNEHPYYLRGSNITINRFFDDAEHAELPWDSVWVRKLHKQIKAMNWNSLRYCIGFPPEFWYDIADEEGILIQDEFPIWIMDHSRPYGPFYCPEFPLAGKIIPEYTAWMRERWNHPCVVIWDASNESDTKETGIARDSVRKLDLSNRPWDNGWETKGRATDCVEVHPYLFSRTWSDNKKPFFLRELAGHSGKPPVRREGPIIINEFDWLWLDRKGFPTGVTEKIYASLLGPNATVDQRRFLHARYVSALTEFWRCHRQAAGVLHFCSLGYSRDGSKPQPDGGQTCDDWVNVRELRYEPYFAEYVKEAFAPVGLMLDFWADTLKTGERLELLVLVINDLPDNWSGQLRLRLLSGDKVISEQSKSCSIDAYGNSKQTFEFTAPGKSGAYTLEAALIKPGVPPTRSLRDFSVLMPQQAGAGR